MNAPRLSKRLFIESFCDFAQVECDVLNYDASADLGVKNLVYFGDDEGIPGLPESAEFLSFGKTEKWGVPYVQCTGNVFIYVGESGEFELYHGTLESFSKDVGGYEPKKIQKSDFIVNEGKVSSYHGLLWAPKMSLPKFYQVMRKELIPSIGEQEVMKLQDSEIPEVFLGILKSWDCEGPLEKLLSQTYAMGVSDHRTFNLRGVGVTTNYVPYLELVSEYESLVMYIYWDGKIFQSFMPVKGNWISPDYGSLCDLRAEIVQKELWSQGFQGTTWDEGGVVCFPDDTNPEPFYDQCLEDFTGAFSSESLDMPGFYIDPKALAFQPTEKLYEIMGSIAKYRDLEYLQRLYNRLHDIIVERNTPEALKRFIGRYYYIGDREFRCLKIIEIPSKDSLVYDTIIPCCQGDRVYISENDKVMWTNGDKTIELQEVGEQVWDNLKNNSGGPVTII